MIVIIVGTERFPFDRLLKVVDRLVEDGVIREEVVMQAGMSNYQPRFAKFVKFMPFEEMSELIRKASFVVAHAGAGTTLLTLQIGRPLILFPRLSRYLEHVDDHQVDFARRMADAGRVMIGHDYDSLKAAVLNVSQITTAVIQEEKKERKIELLTFLHESLRAE